MILQEMSASDLRATLNDICDLLKIGSGQRSRGVITENVKGVLLAVDSERQNRRETQRKLDAKIDECHRMAHVVIESGFHPGVDSPCRCEECRAVCESMDAAGYLGSVTDTWWRLPESDPADPESICPSCGENTAGKSDAFCAECVADVGECA